MPHSALKQAEGGLGAPGRGPVEQCGSALCQVTITLQEGNPGMDFRDFGLISSDANVAGGNQAGLALAVGRASDA